jgi:hypothetical protein
MQLKLHAFKDQNFTDRIFTTRKLAASWLRGSGSAQDPVSLGEKNALSKPVRVWVESK